MGNGQLYCSTELVCRELLVECYRVGRALRAGYLRPTAERQYSEFALCNTGIGTRNDKSGALLKSTGICDRSRHRPAVTDPLSAITPLTLSCPLTEEPTVNLNLILTRVLKPTIFHYLYAPWKEGCLCRHLWLLYKKLMYSVAPKTLQATISRRSLLCLINN